MQLFCLLPVNRVKIHESSRPFPRLAMQATVALPSFPKCGRPLPSPTSNSTSGANATVLPFTSQSAENPGSSKATVALLSDSPSPKRGRPLPTPTSNSTSGANATILPITSQSAENPSPGSSRPSRLAIQATEALPSDLPSPKRGRPLPTSTSNSTSDTSVPPPKKFTPIWKHTLPDYPAPAWGYAVGMVSEPHPKPKTPLPTQPAPAKPDPAVSSAKGTTQRQQYSPSQYRQLSQPVSTYSETQHEDEEDDEEDSEEGTDSDEEDDEDEEQPDPRYNPQNKRQKHTRPMASIASGAGVPSQSLSWGYDQNCEEEMISTPMPKRKLRLKPKVKMNEMDPYTPYMDVNTTNGRKGRIVPRRERDEDITPKATKIILKLKKTHSF
jgi:hypothetical protein